MAEKVEIILEAEDNASGKIENVGDALGTLSSTAMKENLLDLKEAGIGAFNAIGDAVGELSKLAAEDELVAMRLNAQLKALGETANVSEDDINDLADQLSKISGFDDEALVEGQTTLLRFGSLSKEQFQQATEAAADLAAMTGMDLVSAFQQVGIALDNPEQGFGRLKRQIGDMTDAQREAIDAALAMGDTATAQGIILDALAGKVDGAAEAYGETFTGKVGKAQTVVDNFKSSIGELVNSNLPQWLVTTGVAAGEANNLLGPVVSNLADLSLVLIAIKKGGAFAGITGGLVGLKGALAGAGALIAGITAPVWLLIGAIVALGVTIAVFGEQAWSNLKRIAGLISALFDELKKRFILFGFNLVDGLIEGFQGNWDKFKNVVGNAISGMVDFIKRLLGIASPSKLFADEIGKPMAQGVQMGWGQQLGGASGAIGKTLTPSGGMGGRGGATTVVLQYAPAVSMASRAEAETVIVPYINTALRQLRK